MLRNRPAICPEVGNGLTIRDRPESRLSLYWPQRAAGDDFSKLAISACFRYGDTTSARGRSVSQRSLMVRDCLAICCGRNRGQRNHERIHRHATQRGRDRRPRRA